MAGQTSPCGCTRRIAHRLLLRPPACPSSALAAGRTRRLGPLRATGDTGPCLSTAPRWRTRRPAPHRATPLCAPALGRLAPATASATPPPPPTTTTTTITTNIATLPAAVIVVAAAAAHTARSSCGSHAQPVQCGPTVQLAVTRARHCALAARRTRLLDSHRRPSLRPVAPTARPSGTADRLLRHCAAHGTALARPSCLPNAAA